MRRLKPEHWVLAGLAIGSAFLETAVFPYLTVAGARPDLTLLFALLVGILFGPAYGAYLGFGGGIVQDILFGRFIGLNGLTHLVAGYLAGQAGARLFKENVVVPFMIAVLGTIGGHALTYALLRMTGVVLPVTLFARLLLVTAIYNALISVFVYSYLLRLREMMAARADRTAENR